MNEHRLDDLPPSWLMVSVTGNGALSTRRAGGTAVPTGGCKTMKRRLGPASLERAATGAFAAAPRAPADRIARRARGDRREGPARARGRARAAERADAAERAHAPPTFRDVAHAYLTGSSASSGAKPSTLPTTATCSPSRRPATAAARGAGGADHARVR